MRGPETIYAWRYIGSHHEGQWNRSKLSRTEAEYIRADIADARVAAAYEAAAITAKSDGESEWFNPVQAIRALTPNDAKAALEAVRREAERAGYERGLREALNIIGDYDEASDCPSCHDTTSINEAVTALLDNPQEDET